MNKKKRKQRRDNMQDVDQTPVTEETRVEPTEASEAKTEAMDADAAKEPAAEQAEEHPKLDLKAALEAAVAKQEEYLGIAQRARADFENFRRRNENVRKDAFDDGTRTFATTLLPVVDNLERAILAAADSPDEALRSGVEMVYRQLCEAFEKRGIQSIDRLGQPFDPKLENAVMQGEPDEGEPGTVCAVLQKGYQLDGVVLRHAMVKVVPEK